MKAKRYMKPPSWRKPATVTVPYAGPALDGQRPTRTISEPRILSVNPGRKSWEGTKGTTSPCPSRGQKPTSGRGRHTAAQRDGKRDQQQACQRKSDNRI